MSYPMQGTFANMQRRIAILETQNDMLCVTVNNLVTALAEVEHERNQWQNAHGSVVAAKRRLSAKYGAIMRNKLRARVRRARKRLRKIGP